MPRPILATVDPAAVAHNLARVRQCAPQSRAWAVVKADAYGHGIEAVYPALATADGFALLEIAEAARVRACGWTGPILLLEGFFDAADLAAVLELKLTPVIHDDAQIDFLLGARPAAPVDVFVKFNTGMNRLGYADGRGRKAVERLRAAGSIGTVGLMMHFPEADLPDGVVGPLARFERETAGLPGPRSLANSASVLLHPATHADWVRPGILLYGGSPTGDRDGPAFDLRPAMELTSELIAVQQLAPGEAVGYGQRFVAQRPTRIGIVACGYADGYPRHAPDGTPVLIGGERCALAGRVSMDMLTVDITDVPQAGIGSRVELFGRALPVDEVARHCGTIGYELMCAVAPRVARRVIAGGS
ncbi:alanine racemase [Derxia lacustris]|uniref:alanine racemase n=1 Tax=Derxia lacustris TaxID=764842 RepID=UPI000A17288F|nr:alanine racemase [Derxia lacustris]